MGSRDVGDGAEQGDGASETSVKLNRGVVGRAPLLCAVACVVLLIAGSVTQASADAPTLRAMLETVLTLFAFAAAWLVRAQLLHARRLRDLLLLAALLTLGLTRLCAYAVPAALDVRPGSYLVSAAMWAEVFVGAMFAAAALTPRESRVGARRPYAAIAEGAAVATVGVAELGALVSRSALVGGGRAIPRSDQILALRPLAIALVLCASALMVCAAVGFLHRERSEGGGIASLWAAASLLLGAARLSHITAGFPPDEIALTEVLRLMGFSLILVAAVRQELPMRTQLVKAAATEERRRVARDLHDGLAQDLAFIAAHGERIAGELGEEHPVVIAARRALAVSRGAIAQLSDPDAPTTRAGLESVARELSDRFQIDIAVDVELRDELAKEAREHVSRITREAIANAARHGGAGNVTVTLRESDEVVTLAVQDDGCGVARGLDGRPREGFGMRSIRERAASLGGHLSVRDREVQGTVVKVVLP
jgi:signal transduction histidine kinase